MRRPGRYARRRWIWTFFNPDEDGKEPCHSLFPDEGKELDRRRPSNGDAGGLLWDYDPWPRSAAGFPLPTMVVSLMTCVTEVEGAADGAGEGIVAG